MKKISKKINNSRCKQVSVIIQPKVNGDYWSSKNLKDELIEKKINGIWLPIIYRN